MEETRENIIFMFEMYGHKFKDAYNDGSNIVLLTNAHYLVKHDGRWYSVTADWGEFRDKNYESVDINPVVKEYPEEYLQEVYYKHGFDWNERGEMEEISKSIAALLKTYVSCGWRDAWTDGSNIVLSTTSEEAEFLIKYNEKWYEVTFDWDEFCDKNYESADITPRVDGYPEDLLDEWYFSKGFDWNEYGEMEEINEIN